MINFFPTKKPHLLKMEGLHGNHSLLLVFTRFLGSGRALTSEAPRLGHSPRTHLLPLSHPPQTKLFYPEWEAVCQIAPGFGTCWERPWTHSAAQKQSWDKVVARLVQSCKKPDGLISMHVLLYSLIKSKVWQRGVSLLKGTGSERGWKHSRGSDQVINHPFTARPLVPLKSPLDWASRSCQKTTWPKQLLSSQPSKCRGQRGEKQSLQPLLLIKKNWI